MKRGGGEGFEISLSQREKSSKALEGIILLQAYFPIPSRKPLQRIRVIEQDMGPSMFKVPLISKVVIVLM